MASPNPIKRTAFVTCFAFAVIAGAVGVGAYNQRSDVVTVGVKDSAPEATPTGSGKASSGSTGSGKTSTDTSDAANGSDSRDAGVAPSSSEPTTTVPSTTTEAATTGATTTKVPTLITTTTPTESSVPATTSGRTTTTTAAFSSAASREPACPAIDGSSPRTMTFSGPPPVCIDQRATYTAVMETSEGTIKIDLDNKGTPTTVNNFVFLSRYHFYDGLTIHRVVPGFIMQGGDPLANSNGGPGYKFADELPGKDGYDIGAVAMANSGVNSNGSQFFIVTGSTGKALNGTYSTFGKVAKGTSVMKAIDALGVDPGANGVEFPPKRKITIISVTITAAGERESRIPGYASTTSVSPSTTTVG